MSKRGFARFEFKMNFGWISYIAQGPWALIKYKDAVLPVKEILLWIARRYIVVNQGQITLHWDIDHQTETGYFIVSQSVEGSHADDHSVTVIESGEWGLPLLRHTEKSCHDANFIVAGGTTGCHDDNAWCR